MRKHAAAALLFVGPLVLLSACATDEQADDQQTTSPTTTTESAPPPGEQLTAELRTADGTPVAEATFDFTEGFAAVTVETVTAGLLSPGFHGMHIHTVGQCEPDSVSPTGGPPGNFNSAGGHFHLPDSGHPASGDLTSLQVRADGSARLQTTTDAFTAQDLLADDGTALIIHEGPDNFANIPPRYTIDGTPGPDQDTLDTGDAGARFACGVIEGTAATTTETTVTETVPPATTEVPAPAPVPTEGVPATGTETPTSPTSPETSAPETTTAETTSPETTPPVPTTTTAPGGPLPGPAPGAGQ